MAEDLFKGDFVFKSNDSLDTQITASIDRGDFHLSILSLIILILWSTYILFYNSRLIGLLVSFISRRFIKSAFVRVGSVAFSALGGKLMLRDLAFMTNDYSVRCCYVLIVFNYWTRFSPRHKESGYKVGNRCLYIYLYGLDFHIYNRSSVYDSLLKLFNNVRIARERAARRPSSRVRKWRNVRALFSRRRLTERSSGDDTSSNGEDSLGSKAASGSFMDYFWSHAHRLIPAVKFSLELTKVCAGNHLLPRACLLTITRLSGSYTREDATYQVDRYQHKIVTEFVNILCSLIPVVEYAGQHAVEEPPKSWGKAFHVFQFGRGKLTYIQDEPGIVPSEPDHVQNTNLGVPVQRTWPRQGLSIVVNKDCRLHYGPWADRQRNILWKFFFPQSYEPAKVNYIQTPHHPRLVKKFVLELETNTPAELELIFANHGLSKSLTLLTQADSTMKLSIPWLTGPEGFRTTLHLNLVQGGLIAQHLWADVLRTKQLNLDLSMQHPIEWNMPHTWDIDIKAKCAQLTFLYDYKRFFKGLIHDWTRGSHPDLLSFVPCTYKFRINAENLDFILLANEYNWVSSKMENAHVAFGGKRFSFSFDLPFVDFLPDVISVIYNLEVVSVKLRLSLPETSTMLHVLREIHSRLHLVDRSGQRMKENPFKLYEEVVPDPSVSDQSARRCWIDCGRAPSISLRIGYTYHPSPCVSEYWRFLPKHLRPESPTVKIKSYSMRSRHGKRGRKQAYSASDSSSQSELEELALSGLRPEGSQTQGPTEEHLLLGNFDASSLAPDTCDVHLHVPSALLCFYGSLLRHFINLKDNYFGYCQKPVDATCKPLTDEEYLLTLNDLSYREYGSIAEKNSQHPNRLQTHRLVDPRDYRPMLVRLSLEFHGIQAYLPTHGTVFKAPCPVAFFDCIGFEMDKRWHETKLQLIFSPILLCVYDQCKSARPKSFRGLSTGCLQLMGASLRGQGMFSHTGLPLNAESLEYAWLLELTVGQLTGHITAPQLTTLAHALSGFLFTCLDAENQLRCSRDYELCQHMYPESLCPSRPALAPELLCPSESLLKYRLFRLTSDGVSVGVVETGSCMSLQLAPIRLTNCNMHGATRCNGLLLVFPSVRLTQYIRPVGDELRVTQHSSSTATDLPSSGLKTASDSDPFWLEAGCFSAGPIYANVAKVSERPELPLWRLAFLRRHDTATKRLWFLWSSDSTEFQPQHHVQSDRSSEASASILHVFPSMTPNCGCYGQCSYFGSNLGGKLLYEELLSGFFHLRTVFPPVKDYQPHLFSTTMTPSSEGFLAFAYSTDRDNLPDAALPASRFGESLLVAHRLFHELHNPSFCRERSNGLSLLRDEILRAWASSAAVVTAEWPVHRCCGDSEQSDFEEDYSPKLSSSMSWSNHRGSRAEDGTAVSGEKRTHRKISHDRYSDGSNSSPSSMSELLVPPDSPDEDNILFGGGKNADRNLASHLPSNLSLNSLIGPLTPSLSSSESDKMGPNDTVIFQGISSQVPPSLPRRHPTPPVPPPRQFRKMTDGRVTDTDPFEASAVPETTAHIINDKPAAEFATSYDEAFDKFVDLRSQLNRPVTESRLLRSAYSHHLSIYRCRSKWDETFRRIRRRWRLCKTHYPTLDSLMNDTYTSSHEDRREPITSSPFAIALAPRFELIQLGFSPNLIVTNRTVSSFRPSDKQCSTNDSARKTDQQKGGMPTHSDISVWLQGSVDVLLSPLFAESMERFVDVLTPILANLSPSAVVDNMHSSCVKVKSRQIKHLLRSTVTGASVLAPDTTVGHSMNPHVSDPATTPEFAPPRTLSTQNVGSRTGQKMSAPVIFPSTTRKSGKSDRMTSDIVDILADHRVYFGDFSKRHSNGAEPEGVNIVFPEGDRTTDECENYKPATVRHKSVSTQSPAQSAGTTVVPGKLASLSVDHVSLCFLQLYAVEDFVHLDSLRSGLYDLTCVSLLTFCVDSVSFEFMTCYKTNVLPPKSLVASLSPIESSLSSNGSDPCLKPLIQTKKHEHLDKDNKHDLLAEPVANPNQLGSFASLSEKRPSTTRNIVTVGDGGGHHSRQPSAPPVLTATGALETEVASVARPGETTLPPLASQSDRHSNSIVPPESNGGVEYNDQRPSTHVPQEPRGSEMVFQLNIRRVHGQLRRLTRFSRFDSDILLTAIPFDLSRTFFAFEPDKDVQQKSPHPISCWDLHGLGWIMFECGLEYLCLSGNRRQGYLDPLTHSKDVSKPPDNPPCNVSTVEVINENDTKLDEPVAMQVEKASSKGKTDLPPGRLHNSRHYSSKRRKAHLPSENVTKNAIGSSSPDIHHADAVDSGNSNSVAISSNVSRNGVLSRLHVATVWLNFPTPKRLPNKRRIKLVRSDWNLLSTAAPSIRAWMDPTDRLANKAKQLYSAAERRLLAVTTCLMTEAVNFKLPGEQGLLLLHCVDSKDVDAYARLRTATASALRFDPSCQLFVVLRRYLLALSHQHGVEETDRHLNDCLKDSVVPDNEILQCGVLSLTREWRLLVEKLAVTALDLRLFTQNLESPPSQFFAPPVMGLDHGVLPIDKEPSSLPRRTASKAPKAAGTVEQRNSLAALLPSAGVFNTSHLLRLASGPLSPNTRRALNNATAENVPNVASHLEGIVNKHYADDDQTEYVDAVPDSDHPGNRFAATDRPSLVDSSNNAERSDDNIILRRFLHDSKAPIPDANADADQFPSDFDPNDLFSYHPFMKSKSSPNLVSGPTSTSAALADDSLRKQTGLHDAPNETGLSTDYLGPPNVKLTTEDLEQVAHLTAQCRHVAYIQRFFSPLLESVGLNAKGLRRTTLMNKFGGYFSAEGLLQRFHIEIVSSVRNPLAGLSTTSSAIPDGTLTTGPPTHREYSQCKPSRLAPAVGRQSAFLCRNFASKLTFRDILDNHTRKDKHALNDSSTEPDFTPTTTHIDLVFDVDFLRQHINLPLLRLLHQFVTMVYCARDTQKALELRRPVLHPVTPLIPANNAAMKQTSKRSSDGTDSTLRSRSSGYIRFGEGSLENSVPTSVPLLPDLTSVSRPYSTAPHPNTNEPFGYLDQRSSSGSSSTGTEKDSRLIKLHRISFPLTVSTAELPTTLPIRSSVAEHASIPTFTPACWRRLLNYVELYTTVPKTRTVMRRLSTSNDTGLAMPAITEEGHIYSPTEEPTTKVSYETYPVTSNDLTAMPAVTVVKPNILGRRLLATSSYRPLNEDVDSDHSGDSHARASNSGDLVRPSTAPKSLGVPIEHSHAVGRSSLANQPPPSTQGHTPPYVPRSAVTAEPVVTSAAVEKFTFPWLSDERVPLKIFISTKIYQMAVSAVLSELNLSAEVRSVHGTFTHSSQLRGRGFRTEKSSHQSVSLHCDEGQLRLTENLPSVTQEVVCVRSEPSYALVSCRRHRQTERNSCLICIGRISITLPYHPLQLHGVMQRQAKRISSTVFELLRNPQSNRTHLNPWNCQDTSSASRLVTTPTTGSTTTTTTTTTSDATTHRRPPKLSQFPADNAGNNTPAVTASVSSHPPLVFSLSAIARGLKVHVALHRSLVAVYHLNPVYFAGQLGPRGYVEINLTDHSLSLKSAEPMGNFPRSIRLGLPRIITTILRRESLGGRYSRSHRKEQALTHGLTAEQGLYSYVQIKVDTMEQTLTTDMLNYIVIVVKLFMKEIKEVIQKMAGDDQHSDASRHKSLLPSRMASPADKRGNVDQGWLLSVTVRGRAKFTVRIRVEEFQLMATTRSGAIKLEAKTIDVELTNRVSQTGVASDLLNYSTTHHTCSERSRLGPVTTRPSHLRFRSTRYSGDAPLETIPSSGDSLFIYATIARMGAELGYLDQDLFFKERSPEFRTVAFFKTSLALRSLLANEKFASLSSAASRTTDPTLYAGEHDAFLISLNTPTLWLKPFTVDRAILMWMVYKSEFAKWKDYMDYLSSMTSTDANTDHPMVSDKGAPPTNLSTKYATKPRSQVLRSVSPVSSRAEDTLLGHTSDHAATPISSDASHKSVHSKSTSSSGSTSTLFLQLNVEDLGVCLPINITQSNVQSSRESDFRTALVLTLDQSRVSACYRDSLVSQGEFTDFCLRFDDEFNVGSDEWKPDWKRASIDVHGKRRVVILNSCVVPNGTFSVSWHNPEKYAQWNLIIRWQMRGLDFHFDDNVGRRLKALVSILTRITGYNGAAPLLPTSAEEEDESCGKGSTSHIAPVEQVDQQSSAVAAPSQEPPKERPRTEPIHHALSDSHDQRAAYSDIASLDRYVPASVPPASTARSFAPDLAQVRSMEIHKHKQELLDAQHCLAFKRQKWGTLRRKKGTASVSTNTPQSPNLTYKKSPPVAANERWDSESQPTTSSNWARSMSIGCGRLPTDSRFVGYSSPDKLTHSSTTETATFGSAGLLELNSNRISLASKNGSVYFDADAGDVSNTVSTSMQQFGSASTFETASLGTIQTFDGVVRQPGNKRTDSWFNALQTNDVELTASGNEDVNRVDMDDFVVGQEQDESCSSDEADETIMEPNWPDINRMAPPPPPPRQNYVPPPNETAHLVSQPQVQLKLDVQIHVDSGCCVLHPRITPPNGNDNPFPPTHTIDSARPQYFSPPSSRFQTPNTTGFRQCSDTGVRFSNSDFLPLYLERYKRHLLEDIQYLTTDLSVFLLPAVDVGLHYHSMTEMGFHSAIASTLPSLSAPRASNAAPSATFFSRQASFQHLATKVHLRDTGDESECVRRGDEQAVTDGREDDDPRLLCGSGGLKKQTDLYVSCFLQKLPKEWVVHPALLDFLEQALEDLPFVADVDVENAPPSTGDNNTLNQDPKPSTSSLSFNDSAWETFPVHAVVHLRMQPFTARFLCLPTSRMQCLLILPFMDVVFSTNRDSDQPTGTSEVYPPSKDGGPKTNDPDQHYSLPAGRTSHQFALQATEDTVGPVCTLRLPPNPKVGDIVSQGGLCVTAILKEFRISVFHPYVDSASARSERILGATWTGDSLTLLVHDARLNISRRVETTLVRLDHIARSFDTDPAGGGMAGEPNAKPALSRNASASASRSRAMAATSTCPPPLAESWGLHRDVKFSGVFDVGVAVFTCDTRRTLEILDIPNAWYRGSFVRRLFLGNTEPTADTFNEMDRTNEPGDLPHSPLKAAPETADDFVVAVDPIPTTSTEPFSPTRSRYWSLTSPPLLSATDSDQQMDFDAFAPPVERAKLHTLPQPPDATKERRPIDSSNLVSQSTTLLLERGPNTSPSASLRVASWHALPIICFHLKRFDLSLFMGSAMGQTRFVMDQLFCNGRMSLHSSGRKNTTLSAGLGTCQFVSEGGGVGGEMALLDVEARVHLNQAPDCDPQHSFNARIDGFQLRVEYMNTNVLLMRLNSLYLSLQDEWQLREAARQLVARLQTNFAQSGSQSTALRSTHMSAPVKFTLSDDGVTGDASGSALKTPTVETDVGAPPICIRVVGDISWDQAQVAIVRTTTPDLIHSYSKVREYFEEQVREGRNSLIGRGGSFQMFSTSTSGRSKPLFRRQPANGTEQVRKQQQRDLIDRLLQRHWQSLLRDSINFYTHQLANFDCTDDPLSILNACGIDRLFPVMGGSLQLSGRSLGVACYAGSLRSAPDWAVFNIQYPTVCFETEAQREPLASGVTPPDPLESDGWINVRQVLSFDLISRPEYQPQMAYVIRVRRGSQPITRNPPILTIEEWLEFTFRGADNTVTNFVRSNDPGSLPSVVQLSQFPARFPASIPATSPLMTVERSHFSRHQHLETVHENIPSRYVSTVHPPGSGSKPPWPSASVQGSSDDATKQAQPPTHSNPLKPPTEGEIIFILPSISLRITTDQRQPMAQPTLSSLSSISAEKKKSSPPPSPFTDEPDHPHSTPTPAKSTGSWLYGHKAATTPDSTDESEPVSLGQMHDGPGKRVATHAPSVKVSFQTDFHGFIQLGLIDVSWLPTLINSYLKERLQDYEDSTFATPSYRTSGDPTSQDADLTKCLRELASTSSPMVQDARTYEVIHWSFSPVCRWLLASNICVPAFDRLLARVGFQKARTTIPKWLQRGLMDHLDRLVAVSLHACMRLVPEQQSSTSLKPVPSICHVETTDDTVDHTPRSHTESPTHQAFPTDFAYRPH